MKPADEERDPTGTSDPAISRVHAQIGERLRKYYSEVAPIEIGSRLADVLDRLSAALDAAEAGQQVPGAFKDDLIALVPRLRRYALSLTFDGVEADDLVQFTLLKAWEHRQRFQPGTRLVAWLFTILRNGFINGRRKRRLEIPDPDGVHATALSEPAAQEHSMGLKEIEAAIDRLEPAYREALILVAVDGLPYEVAASVIGCPAGTVKSRVSRARDRLLHELGER
ncbi:sigma-70 family RNA polymerase sigma factor [Methylobacterium sp. NMS14P]|uniref:sigma-70 family RNA polymerase sigma factor n=1 Tax=Methylobacterium sp. NMS14P TaxID=2894310 RepID=UPI002359015E|nr:sigma-70 family RNA polymerase sigma factor [Methylobacterium sp. NMS14P]WCS25207.1 sigma-70 family RNA polymerase sigma factor [Methylobacterium sp. NMS14P]